MTRGWISAVVKGIGGGNMGEAHEGMHDGKLARVVEL
jgi:hypothetical protein